MLWTKYANTSERSSNQHKASFGYDALDRLKTWALGGAVQEAYDYNVIGNMTSKNTLGTLSYNDPAHKHALTHITAGQVAEYDGNGNMTRRWNTVWYRHDWNVDNKMTTVKSDAGAVLMTLSYDADGNRVKTVAGSTTTVYVGNYYENTGGLIAKYYYFGGQRVAVRNTAGLNWLHGDHLGSASVTTNMSGNKVAELRYKPFGEVRFSSGTLPTNRKFNGNIDDGFGTLDYGARMLSPLFGRFLSADSIVPRPSDPQSLNRYSYARNNPMNRVDPSGHCDQAADRSSDACWKKYEQVTRKLKLGYETGIDAWDIAQLTRLERRLAAGTKFISVDIKDPNNSGKTLKSGKWNANNFSDVLDALDRVDGVSSGKLAGATSKITFNKLGTGGRDDPGSIGDWANAGTRRISLHLTSKREEYAIETTIHGIGHLLDGALGSYSANNPEIWGTGSGSVSDYGNTGGSGEDFAESFTWMVESRAGGNGYQNNGNSVTSPSQSRQDAFADLQVSKGR